MVKAALPEALRRARAGTSAASSRIAWMYATGPSATVNRHAPMSSAVKTLKKKVSSSSPEGGIFDT